MERVLGVVVVDFDGVVWYENLVVLIVAPDVAVVHDIFFTVFESVGCEFFKDVLVTVCLKLLRGAAM